MRVTFVGKFAPNGHWMAHLTGDQDGWFYEVVAETLRELVQRVLNFDPEHESVTPVKSFD